MGIFERLKNLWRANTQQTERIQERTLLNLQPRDILEIEDRSFEVEGSVTYNDHGYRWIEYKLKDKHTVYWMSVEQDDDLEVSLHKDVVAVITEPPRQYEYEGVTYYMQEGSDARIEAVNGLKNIVVGEGLDYYEYKDPTGKKLLGIMIWDGAVEMSVGEPIEPYRIQIYPGKME